MNTSIWKWLALYILIAAVAYGLVYYFFLAENSYNQTVPAVTNDQELMSASADLEATNVDQIDAGLQENESDASAF